MYYEIKSNKTIYASQKDTWKTILQETETGFSAFVTKQFKSQGQSHHGV